MLIFITGILLYPYITGILLYTPIFVFYQHPSTILRQQIYLPNHYQMWRSLHLFHGECGSASLWGWSGSWPRFLPEHCHWSHCPHIVPILKVKILILCKIISTLHSAEYTLQQREWGVHKPVHNLWQIGQRFHSLWSCSVWWLDRLLHLTHRLQNPLQTEKHVVNS